MKALLLSTPLESFIQLVGALLIFAAVLAAAYLTTRWMGGMQKGRMDNKNLHIVETIAVGQNKTVAILEAGTVYLVIAVGKEDVRLLAQLSHDELKDFSFEQEKEKRGAMPDSFAEILGKMKGKIPQKQDRK